MGPGDHVHRDELADFPGRRRARVRGGLHGRDVAANDGRDLGSAYLLPADQRNLGGLYHRV